MLEEMNSDTFEITNKTKRKLPSLPFLRMKEHVLGKKYELSLVFIGNTRSRKLNKTYRGKDKPANILSFPLSKTEGEIFIDLSVAKKQASQYDKSYTNFVALLVIHGMFHLKGFAHGGKMEESEKKVRAVFGV